MKETLVLGFPEYDGPAHRLAGAIGADYQVMEIHHFPDGESLVRFPVDRLPSQVIFCRSLDRPNEKLLEMMLAVETARELGAEKVTLVAPYLCYMRQDKAFQPGEAVSQRVVGHWLAGLFDQIITVDPHLHRVPELTLALPQTHATALTAAAALGNFLKQQVNDALLLGPDEESIQWVEQIAEKSGFPFAVADKLRLGENLVEIQLPPLDYTGKTIVLVDDIVSTGHTMATTAKQLKSSGAAKVHTLFTHALFCNNAIDLLTTAGVDCLWSSDSILHTTNRVKLAPLLAEALRRQ